MLAYFGIALAVQMQQPHAAASSIVPVTSVARPPLPINENTTRAKAIVARMTNAEKASLLNGIKSSAYVWSLVHTFLLSFSAALCCAVLSSFLPVPHLNCLHGSTRSYYAYKRSVVPSSFLAASFLAAFVC